MYENLQTLKIEIVREKFNAELHQMKTSKDINKIMKKMVNTLDRECFWVIPLNGKNKIIGINLVSMGDVTSSIVHPREVFKACILTNAVNVIFAHNHPSGDPAPSEEDIKITARLKKAGEILGIKVLDHVIIGEEDNYFSFVDDNLL